MNKDCSLVNEVVLKEKYHRNRKGVLGGRVQVLRVLIRNYYRDKRLKYTEYDFIRHCEAVLDNVLARYEYDIERIIDGWRKVTPKLKEYPATCPECGYRPPFCNCESST